MLDCPVALVIVCSKRETAGRFTKRFSAGVQDQVSPAVYHRHPSQLAPGHQAGQGTDEFVRARGHGRVGHQAGGGTSRPGPLGR